MEFLEMLPGWVILVPFIVLGVVLRARWLGAITVLVLLLDTLVWFSPGIQEAGPGTYTGWAALGLIVVSLAGLVIMWASAGTSALTQWVRDRNA